MEQEWEYFTLLVVSMALSIGLGIFAFRRGKVPAARLFGWSTFLEAFWTFAYMGELTGRTLEMKLAWDSLQWIPTVGLPALFFAFASRYTGYRLRYPSLFWGTVIAISTLILAVVALDGSLHLLRTHVHLEASPPFEELVYGFAPLHRAANVFVIALQVAGMILLAAYLFRAPRLYRSQAAVILAGASFPFICAFLGIIGIRLGFQRDIFPFSVMVMNLAIAWGLFRFRFLDVMPLARELVIENLNDMVLILDGGDRVLDVNPSMRRLLAASDPIGLPMGEASPLLPGIVARLNASGGADAEIEVELGGGNGSAAWASFRLVTLGSRDGQIEGRVLIGHDISRLKAVEIELRSHRDRLEDLVAERTAALSASNESLQREMAERGKVEEQFRQSQKMEALGRLAGGVAHDLNNLLVPIMGCTDMALMDLAENSPAAKNLKQVRNAAERAADLARQVLAFSRRQVLQTGILNLNLVLTDLDKMLRRLIGEDLNFVVIPAPEPLRIKADRSQIEQIIVNLTVNARDAMPGGGDLTLRLAGRAVGENGVQPHWIGGAPPPGRYAVLEIIDTGCGMDPSTRDQIFEPFFTTKPTGKGTGLGLSIVFGIVKQHGGAIALESSPGMGSAFSILLPLTGDALPSIPEHSTPHAELWGGETILVVDDEEVIGRMAQSILELHHYKVLRASDPADALRIAAAHPEPIHLLLTDFVMPGMNGRALAEQIARHRPGLKILYCSGYSDQEMADRGLLGENENFLPKPYNVQILARKVREVLGGTTSSS